MTKTEHIELNLMDPHDPVSSAAALNANAQALDAAITADRAAIAAEHSAVYGEIGRLDGRADALTALVNAAGNCKIAWGSYAGTGTHGTANPTVLTFPFRPALVVVMSDNGGYCVLMQGCGAARVVGEGQNSPATVTWSGNSVACVNNTSSLYQNNYSGRTYTYIVLGCEG